MKRKIVWHNLNFQEVARILNTDVEEGLSEKEVKIRHEKFGRNLLPEKKSLSGLKLFLRQLKSPLIYILIIVGIVVLILEDYPHNLIESGFVFVVILINSFFGFWEENKSSKTLKKLKRILKTKAVTVREGKKREVLQEDLVPGDIYFLNPGDKVPADGRLIEVENLKIDEAVLTGEWLSAKKQIKILPRETPLADRDNMIYSGCLVEDGKGKAIAISIGEKTEMGEIALLVKEAKEEKTPLQKKLARFSKLIGAMIVGAVFFIFGLGIIRGQDPIEMFETGSAIAVGGIPEALPVVITLVLAVGMERILKKKGLIRKLSSVETLGSTSIICCDKTKTLTKGKMELDEVVAENKNLALKIAALCNEAFIENPQENYKNWKIRGSPTDRALLLAGTKFGILRPELEKEYKILKEIPFDPTKKYQASLIQKENIHFLFISGAPERIFDLSKLTGKELRNLKERLTDLTKKGLRVIGLAKKEISKNKLLNFKRYLKDFNFVGFISLKDPLRKGVKEAIEICQDAGLRPVIITGDHKNTAKTITQEIGLKVKEGDIIEGKDLDEISDSELEEIVSKIKIYARAEPKHKIRVVRAWQNKGEVVAMTGDGVNDAPALKKADIGIALGSGDEVAKETSDLVLLTDGFNIIVKAIEEGRVILDNVRKSISYVMADAFTSVILVGFSVILGWPLPILWTQILWNNILEDTLPAISLVFEPEEKEVMKREPPSPKTPLLTKEIKILIFATGLIDELLILFLFWIFWARLSLNLDYVRTVMFGAICTDTAFVVYSYKNLRKNLWRINLFTNKILLAGSALALLGFALAIYLPSLQTLLHTVPLGIGSWLILILIGLISVALIEITKWHFISRKETEI